MNKLLLVCLLVFAPVSMASADLKIAVIDLSKAFDQYYKTKDAQSKLKEKQDGYQKEIQDLKVERTREIQEELLRRHKEIVDEISKVISDYSGPQGYDMVLDKSSQS